MDSARYQLLAGTALAGDEHVAHGRAGFGDLSSHCVHGCTFAKQTPVGNSALHGPAKQGRFLSHRPLLEQPAHPQPELVELERFDDVIGGALAKRLYGRLHRSEGRDQDEESLRLEYVRLAQQIHAAQSRHDDIADDQVETLIRHDGQRFFCAPGRADAVAILLQTPGERVLNRALIVDNEDRSTHANSSEARGSCSNGSTTVNAEPTPGWLSTDSSPPCCRTIS